MVTLEVVVPSKTICISVKWAWLNCYHLQDTPLLHFFMSAAGVFLGSFSLSF